MENDSDFSVNENESFLEGENTFFRKVFGNFDRAAASEVTI